MWVHSHGEIQYDMANRPGVSNLLQIMALLSKRPLSEVAEEWSGKTSYGDFKQTVAQQVQAFLEQFQTNLAQVDQAAIQAKLQTSEAAMNQVANATLLRVQKAVGLRA